MINRRVFLGSAGVAILASAGRKLNSKDLPTTNFIKPEKLKKNDTIGIIAPGSAVTDPSDLNAAAEVIDYFGLKYKIGKHVISGSGYKTRTEEERLDDLHTMFSDESVKAVFAIRGGYGSAQLLDKIDYDLIRDNPKIFLGFSDITALHLAINKFSRLITFHGPVMLSSFTEFTAANLKKMLFEKNDSIILKNPETMSGIRKAFPVRKVNPGNAKGRLIGGNLTIISTLMGTDYQLDSTGKLLFFEDIGEKSYRIDRMLNQLRLSDSLKKAAGIIIGTCYDCERDAGTWDPETDEVLDNYISVLKVPAFSGLLIGHTANQLTIPVGATAAINADEGLIEITETCVE